MCFLVVGNVIVDNEASMVTAGLVSIGAAHKSRFIGVSVRAFWVSVLYCIILKKILFYRQPNQNPPLKMVFEMSRFLKIENHF